MERNNTIKKFLKTKCSYGINVQKLIAEVRIFIWRIPFKCIVRKIAGFCSIGTTSLQHNERKKWRVPWERFVKKIKIINRSYGTKVQKLIAEVRIFIWRIPFKCIVRKIAGFCSIGTTSLQHNERKKWRVPWERFVKKIKIINRSYGTKVQKLIAEVRIFIWRIPFKFIVKKC